MNGHEKQRWRVATDHYLVRRNRKGVRHQQLCGEIALLLTWLQVSWLHGLIDGVRRIKKKIIPIRAEKQFERFKREYRKARLHLARPDFVAKQRAYAASRDRRRPGDAEQLE